MADEDKSKEGESDGKTQTGDDVKNIKSEFDRKINNLNTKMETVVKSTQELITQLNNQAVAKLEDQINRGSEKPMSDLLYDDPEAYAKLVEERAEKKAMDRMNQTQEKQQKNANIINRLVADYPELSDAKNELTKRAAEILQIEDKEGQADPRNWKTAVFEAAQELGVKPVANRTGDEDFSIGSSGTTRRRGKRRDEDDEIPQETKDFGRLLGLDVDSPEVQKRLKGHMKRNWNKYR